jgi:hypothetical protein
MDAARRKRLADGGTLWASVIVEAVSLTGRMNLEDHQRLQREERLDA